MTDAPITTRRGREQSREHWTGKRAADLDQEQLTQAGAAGYEPGPDGYMVGRDPRMMTRDELLAMGRGPMSAPETIRAKCLDCCAGSPYEVRYCPATACPNWDRRMGKDMWRAPPSEVQREASRRNAARMHAVASVAVNRTGLSAGTGEDGPK